MVPRLVAVLTLVLVCTSPRVSAAPLTYTANSCSSDVSVIDVTAGTVRAAIPVAATPKGIAVAPDGLLAYVVNAGAEQVSVIDLAAETVVATIQLGAYAGIGNLQSIVVSPDGAFVYVPRANALTLAVIDTASRSVVATIPLGDFPEGIVLDPTGAFAYVGVGAQSVAVVDTAARAVVATIDLGFSKLGPTDLAITPDGEVLYVATQNWYLKALDPQTNALITTLNSAGGDVFGVAVTPDGSRIYATEFFAPSVLVFDTATNLLVTSIPVTSRPRDVAITPDGALALVPGEFNTSPTGNDVTIIDVGTNTVSGSIAVGCGPVAIAIAPDTAPASRLTALSSVVQAASLGSGMETSLLSPLDAALGALDRDNRAAACGSLTAFVRRVGAQSGTGITRQDATLMLGQATEVKTALGCR